MYPWTLLSLPPLDCGRQCSCESHGCAESPSGPCCPFFHHLGLYLEQSNADSFSLCLCLICPFSSQVILLKNRWLDSGPQPCPLVPRGSGSVVALFCLLLSTAAAGTMRPSAGLCAVPRSAPATEVLAPWSYTSRGRESPQSGAPIRPLGCPVGAGWGAAVSALPLEALPPSLFSSCGLHSLLS